MEHLKISWYSNFSEIDNVKSFKNVSSNIGKSLLIKLRDAKNNFNLETVFKTRTNLGGTVFKLIKNIDETSKAAGKGKLPRGFLKDGAEIWPSLQVKLETSQSLTKYFLLLVKLQNSNLFQRKEKKLTNYGPSYCH